MKRTSRFGTEVGDFQKTVMEQSRELTTASLPLKKHTGLSCQRAKSFFGNKMRLPTSKSKINKRGDQHKSDSGKSPRETNLPLKFEPAKRRAAICAVLEEEPLYSAGIPLSELRKDLVVRSLLDKVGLL